MTLATVVGSCDKAAVLDSPTYVVTADGGASSERPARNSQKKYIIIAVSAVLTIGLIIAAILVGMHIFAEQQKAIVQFSLQFKSTSDNELAKQDVVSDPNDNVVQYHVTKPGQDVYIVNDFNKDLQIVKIQTADQTNCYVSPLNRSAAMDPNSISGPSPADGSTRFQPFLVSNTPVSDRSFLTKKAAVLCKDISLYWAYRDCSAKPVEGQQNVTLAGGRQKRTLYNLNPLYGMPGVGGCCLGAWACGVLMTETIVGVTHSCQSYYQTGTCCGRIAAPYCQNVYYQHWSTPGLKC